MKMRFAMSMLTVVAGVCSSSLEAYAQTPIKVVQWNVEDNQCLNCGGTAVEPDELAAIVNQDPDIVFLQEVDRVTHLNNIVAALGPGWSHRFTNRDGTRDTSGNSFLAILSRFPIVESQSVVPIKVLNHAGEVISACPPTTDPLPARAAIGATIEIDGKRVAVFSTRNTFRPKPLTDDCIAEVQNRRFKDWANATFPDVTHLYGGDFNMVPGQRAYTVMTLDPNKSIDVWKEALDKGTADAVGQSEVFNTPTRSGGGNRLDYLFYKNVGTALILQSAQITALQPTGAANDSDDLASDHRMMTAIMAVDGPPPLPTDDFNDNILHAQWSIGVWSGTTRDSTIPVAETNQRLQIGPLKENLTGNHYNAIRSVGSYNLSGAYAYVQVVQPAATTTGAHTMFSVGRDANNYYRWYVSAGRLVGEKEIAGTKIRLVDIGYDPAGHQFLRICHDSSTGNVVFQTAPHAGSGLPGAWFQHTAEAWNTTAVPLATVLFEMKAGTGAPEIAPGTAAYDNFRAARVASCQ